MWIACCVFWWLLCHFSKARVFLYFIFIFNMFKTCDKYMLKFILSLINFCFPPVCFILFSIQSHVCIHAMCLKAKKHKTWKTIILMLRNHSRAQLNSCWNLCKLHKIFNLCSKFFRKPFLSSSSIPDCEASHNQKQVKMSVMASWKLYCINLKKNSCLSVC